MDELSRSPILSSGREIVRTSLLYEGDCRHVAIFGENSKVLSHLHFDGEFHRRTGPTFRHTEAFVFHLLKAAGLILHRLTHKLCPLEHAQNIKPACTLIALTGRR